MDQLCTSILMLSRAGKGDRKDFASCTRFHHVYRWILHGQFRTEVPINPLHNRVFVGKGSLCNEVVDVVGPVLNRCVTATTVLFHNHFDNRRVK